MSPAAAFVWIVVGATAAWLLLTSVVPATLNAFVLVGRKVRPLSTPVAMIVATILLFAAVRPSPSAASVAPPAERVMVEVAPHSGETTIRNPITLRTSHVSVGQSHTVVKGDSLWRIARGALEESEGQATGAEITALWKAIYVTNTDVIGGDPNLIHPGQVLTIPGGFYG